MSSLTSLGYTASQYAVMTSALAWTGKTLKGFSGAIVEQLQQGRDLIHAYALFYLGAAAIGIPGGGALCDPVAANRAAAGGHPGPGGPLRSTGCAPPGFLPGMRASRDEDV